MKRFAGKTIVVTGSGREKGLGQAILQRFADEGAACVVSDLDIGHEAEGVVEELRARGATVAPIRYPTRPGAMHNLSVSRA